MLESKKETRIIMKIAIIGAGGKAGSAIYRDALARNHDVTAIVRSIERARAVLGSDVVALEKDSFELTAEDLQEFDAVVNAVAFAPAEGNQHVVLAQHLVSVAASGTPRLVFILGAGSLFAGSDRHHFIEDIRQAPGSDEWIAIPENQLKELHYLESVNTADWVGISPQASFIEGGATTPAVGTDEIMFASDGESHTTTGTLAVAILDELENPTRRRVRFTVGDE